MTSARGERQARPFGAIVLSLIVAAALLLAGSSTTAAQSSLDSDGDGLTDAFEEAWGVTRPDLADSDGDGVSDASEDLDGDSLSGLGEQRYGTDPGNPDSDGDGVGDGDEDSDGDGISDAREQDERPLPEGLHPEPDAAWWDRPVSYNDGCHTDLYDPELYPCVYGDTEAERQVVIFGDSHALQWFPALLTAAEADGWQVVTMTKAACPPVDVPFERAPKYQDADPICFAWRDKAMDWIAQNEPELVVMSGAGRHYKVTDGQGRRLEEPQRTARWQEGIASIIDAMPETTTAIVLADTPQLRANPASCLPEHPRDISACVTPRRQAWDTSLDDAERAVAEENGAVFESLNDLVCSYDPCPIVMEDVMMWRNNAHITATFAERLAPSMRGVLERGYAHRAAELATVGDGGVVGG